jgi:peptidoglycan/LPS O-acetylase OafA/YrhL
MRRAWRVRLAVLAVLVVATIVCVLAFPPGSTGFGIGWGIFGVAFVVAVAYAFLAVGESEDRDRERHRHG